jgi:hypothetical protein
MPTVNQFTYHESNMEKRRELFTKLWRDMIPRITGLCKNEQDIALAQLYQVTNKT